MKTNKNLKEFTWGIHRSLVEEFDGWAKTPADKDYNQRNGIVKRP